MRFTAAKQMHRYNGCGDNESGRDANRRCHGQGRLQYVLQQIIKGRNSGFWVAPKIYCSKAQKRLTAIRDGGIISTIK